MTAHQITVQGIWVDKEANAVTFPRWVHQGQRSRLLSCLGSVLMVVDALHRGHIPNRAVYPLLVVLPRVCNFVYLLSV